MLLCIDWAIIILSCVICPLVHDRMCFYREYQILFNKLIPASIIVALSSCGTTQPQAYQKERTPEDRNQYVGAEGLSQYQKDQNYLLSKALSDKCTKAKVDLAIARTNDQASEIKKQKALIARTCV